MARCVGRTPAPLFRGDKHGVNRTAYPAGWNPDNVQWHFKCPATADVAGRALLVPVRDPVERFRSACAQTRRSAEADAVLAELENPVAGTDGVRGARRHASLNVHFWPQIGYAERPEAATVRLYRFPDHLGQLAADAGLAWPLPTVNEAAGEKPDLTPEQVSRAGAHYAADRALFAGIAAPGQPHSPAPPPPQPDLSACGPACAKRSAAGGHAQAGTRTPEERFADAIAAGCEVGGVVYGIAGGDQIAWTAALAALDNAAAHGAFDPATTPVESVLGPILDIAGRPAPTMTVVRFRQTMLALAGRIGALRAEFAGAGGGP